MGLDSALLGTIRDKKFAVPTDIQSQTIPHALNGRDILGCAQTGTGKTAAFVLPILQRLGAGEGAVARQSIRALIVAPTRELAAQIGQAFGEFAKNTQLRHTVIFGGVNQRPQCAALRRGVDILIATPGRLLDLIGQNQIKLDNIEVLVLDEADRMLDMGFLPDIRRIINLVPKKRQTMLFSATIPQAIKQMSGSLLHKPFCVSIAPEAPAAETVRQVVRFVQNHGKLSLLKDILACRSITKAIVFTRTKHRADKIARQLERASIPAAAMHSNKSQNERQRILSGLRSGRLRVLVASDIASRGIDVSDISHVFNYDMPREAETYVHRIGRTGRAGAEGQAVSFCSDDEKPFLKQIERLLTHRLPVFGEERTERSVDAPDPRPRTEPPAQRHRRKKPGSVNRSGGSGVPGRDRRRQSGQSKGRRRRNSPAAKR